MDLRDKILKFPEQIKAGLDSAKDFKLDREYKHVILCGMGGSIIPAEIFVLFAGQNHLETGYEIWKDYDLPPKTAVDDLVVCISWSGTTEETISSCQAAISKNLQTVVITKGGELGEIARQNNLRAVVMPQDDLPPRFATGYMTAALFSVLGYGQELGSSLDPKKSEDKGRRLAGEIGDKIPLLYSSFPWRKITAAWKILFNENCKIHAFWNTFPGLSHNELAAFQQRSSFYPIIFRESEPNPRIEKNFKAAIAIFKRMGYNYNIVNLSEETQGNALEIALNNYLLGLWTSYYLAQNLGVKPEDINLIEEFKQLKKEA